MSEHNSTEGAGSPTGAVAEPADQVQELMRLVEAFGRAQRRWAGGTGNADDIVAARTALETAIRAALAHPTMLNGMTEAETSASVAGLSDAAAIPDANSLRAWAWVPSPSWGQWEVSLNPERGMLAKQHGLNVVEMVPERTLGAAEARDVTRDPWASVKHLLDGCPYSVRCCEGGGSEDLLASLCVTFRGMQMRLERDPMFMPRPATASVLREGSEPKATTEGRGAEPVEPGRDSGAPKESIASPAAAGAQEGVPAEVLKIHPQSLRGLVEGAGGNYLTGGGAAFTSVALAKFVVSAVEALATHPAPQAAPDIIESVCDILCRMNEAPGTHTRESWKSEIRRAIVGLRTGALPAPQAPAAGAEVAPSESNEWIKQARRTLDRLAAFLQRIGAPHAIDWREWIHNAEVMVLALQDPAAVKQSLTAAPGEPRELARAVLIAEEAQQFAEDRTHLGRRVYINDLVWALRTLAAARAEPAGGRVDEREALANLVRYVERNECQHESTHRGGSIWTICDDCGRKWADDRGGFKPYEPAPELEAARAALSAQQPQEKP